MQWLHRVWKGQPLGGIYGAGHISLQNRLGRMLLPYLETGHGGQQGLGIGVEGFVEQGV